MPNCKRCGATYSFLSKRDDGLCRDCRGRELADLQQRELDRTQKKIEVLVEAITSDEPLCVTFVRWDVKKKGADFLEKLPGLVAGVAVGGAIGEMIFGGTLIQKGTYTGQLGILVVTGTQMYLWHFTAPFMGESASIISDHLDLFQQQCRSNNVTRKSYAIGETSVSIRQNGLMIASGSERITLFKSELYVNDTVYKLDDLPYIRSTIAQNGAIVTPEEFIEKLKDQTDPISMTQYNIIKNGKLYMMRLIYLIVNRRDRDALANKFTFLTPSVRSDLESRIASDAALLPRKLIMLGVYLTLVVFGIIGMVTADTIESGATKAVLGMSSMACGFIALVLSIMSAIELRRIVNSRKLLGSRQ